VGIDNPLRHLDSSQVRALRDLPHALQCIVCAAAERVHEDAFGLIDDRSRAGSLP
jgi:hypothetical protein